MNGRHGNHPWQGRHVVICNWRDSGHPSAGGAELYCERVAAELHREGVRVTYVTARAKGQSRRSEAAFGSVVRGGGTYTVYLFVLFWLLRNRGVIDGVIDSQNGIPFFTPLALSGRTPIALLIHHVHQDQFLVHFPKPAARVGQFLENQGSRAVYGSRALAAVSPSSRAEIRRRLSMRGPVHLAPCGQEMPPPRPRRPNRVPRIVCVGRLVTQKRFDVLLRALPPGVELHLVGDGEARAGLERLAAELQLGPRVVFHGRVGDAARDALVDSAWLTASASMGEGWGLSVMEAAAAGVPAVAFSVPGLRDTIRPGETGWLAEPGADDELPGRLYSALDTALRELSDPRAADAYARRCAAWAARFTWAATAAHLTAVLTAEEQRLTLAPSERRPGSDSATLVTMPAADLRRADLTGLRVTDQLDVDGNRASLLLVGADEQDAHKVLQRLDVAGPDARIRLARHRDLLGWQMHPPTRDTGPNPSTGVAAVPDRPGRLRRLILPLGVFLLALTVRLIAIGRAYDIFVDEISYAMVARNLVDGAGLTLNGGPFHLHPPGFFLVLAGVFDAVGLPAGTTSLVLDARPVAAVAGAVGCAAATLLLARIVRWPIALGAGLLLALDPFLLRFDSRVMLEAPAMAWALLGLVVLTIRPRRTRGAVAWGVLAGLFFGASVLTKEWYVFVTIVPLVLLLFTTNRVRRRMRLSALVTAALAYAGYVIAMAALGILPQWWAEKATGLARVTGAHQVTGFNQPGAESLGSRVVANLTSFGASYLLITVGGLATVALLAARRRRPWQFLPAAGGASVVLALGVGAFAFIGYAVGFGTLEEQMFYPVVVTSVVVTAAGLDIALRLPGPRRAVSHRRLVGVLAGVTAAVLFAGNAGIWADVRFRPDDTYRELLAWAPRGFPPGSTVATTEDVAQFVLTGVRLGQWADVASLRANRVDYVVISTALAERGYGHARPEFVHALDARASVVFTSHGRTMGDLRVYDVRELAGHGTAQR
ncbi:glycosyltransferase [Actinoplanes sp. Pm04-4]|uniref:Glycosyltransferase n=1 Tax=Paractinoplanes pyxinae TaxID=2997416 RepID=A0ABT4B5S3_9ACTN|nr:glycosyltransferase [Actinoplanes pyxinae]MCY1141847.1 glycosyltransferase [Actinoplanes pyxinae]